jgi:peroxiredoxin
VKRVIEILLLISMLVSGLVSAGCSSTPAPAPEPKQGFNVGNLAPDFQLQRLDGQVVTLSSLRGSPVLLNFWATWCGPCRVEIPFIQEVFEDEKRAEQGLVILAINAGEASSKVKQFMEQYGLSFHVLLDKDTSVARNYNVRGIPTTFFIDKNGIIKDMKVGAFLSREELDGRLDNLMLDGK